MSSLPFLSINLGEDLPELHIEKNGKLFELKGPENVNGRSTQIYIVCNQPQGVRYGFSTSQWQDASKGEGTFVLVCNESMANLVDQIDEVFRNYFIEQYADVGSTYLNMKWTRATVDQMFKKTLWNNGLKCHVAMNDTDFFDCNKKKLSFYGGVDKLVNGSVVTMVVMPAYAWVFNKQIGIRWTAKQVMSVPGKAPVLFDPEPDYSDIEDDEVKSVISECSSTWSLGDVDDTVADSVIKENEIQPVSWSLMETESVKQESSNSASWSLMDTEPVVCKSEKVSTTSWSLMDEEVYKSEQVTTWSLMDEPIKKKKKTKKILVKVVKKPSGSS